MPQSAQTTPMSQAELAVLLSLGGLDAEAIGSVLGVEPDVVRATLSSPRALEVGEELEKQIITHVAARAADVQTQLKAVAGEAVEVLVEQMRFSANDRLRQQAALAILDRAGYTSVNKMMHLHASLPTDLVDRMERLSEDLEQPEMQAAYQPRQLGSGEEEEFDA
jgi:hypothetical protein